MTDSGKLTKRRGDEAEPQRRQEIVRRLNEYYAKGADPAEKRLVKLIKAKVSAIKEKW